MINRVRVSREKSVQRSKILSAAALCSLLLWGQTAPLLANPTGGTVVSGNSTIGSSGSTETITQTSKNSIINWQTFSINGGETTKFMVPNRHSATLNRVTGGDISSIYGTLESNGKIILINPNGMMIGPGGLINTSSFIGSTLDVSNDEFAKGGNLSFLGTGTGSVVNDGSITASNGGVYLIANEVTNNGSLTAAKGDVGLAAGSDVLFQQEGDQHLFVQASNAATPRATGVTQAGTIMGAAAELKAAGGNAYALAINNSGQITATGYKKINGQVILTGDTGAVENSGTIRATTGKRGGRIELTTTTGGIMNAGVLDASATGTDRRGGNIMLKSTEGMVSNSDAAQLDARGGDGGTGGQIEMSGGQVQALGLIDTTSVNGTTGMFTIDPATFTVAASGGDETGTQVAATLATTDVTLNADNAVNINDGITWTSTNTLTLSTNVTGSTISINSPISGVNGGLTINTAASTDLILPNAAVNVSNFILQDGYWEQNFTALPAFSATHDFEVQGSSTFLRASGGNGTAQVPYQITDIYGLQGLASTALLGSDAELVNNVDASGTASWNAGAGFAPIGTDSTYYTGVFNGQGNVVQGLTIDRTSSNVGLFGITSGTIENVGLENASISGGNDTGGLVGALGNDTSGTGGVGTVSDTFVSGSVTGGSYVGGLVGLSHGTSISDSYNSSTVSGDGFVGGLVGSSITAIDNSYNVGAVTAGGGPVGGLVGENYYGASVTDSYSSGAVNGTDEVGGLVGRNLATITGSFWDTQTSGAATNDVGSGTDSGVTGETTATLLEESTYSDAGWDIGNSSDSTWVIFNGQTRPMLGMEYSTDITNGHQLQLVGLNADTLTADYTLGSNVDLTGTTNASDVWGTSTTNGGAGFVPIGTYNGDSDAQGVVYHGTFNGQGFTINGLYIDTPNSDYVALFGDSGHNTTIENLNLTGVNVTGGIFVAGLVAVADSTFQNDSSSGSVTGLTYVGGMFGNVYGSVSTSYTSGTVTGSYGGSAVGGLAGLAQGGTVDSSYSTATISANSSYEVGGLIGDNDAAVTNVYSTGSVDGYTDVGGLVGYNGGSISNAYTTSSVIGGVSFGAFAGDEVGTISESFYDTDTAGGLSGVGSDASNTEVTGATTAQLMSQSYILSQAPNWDFTNVWSTNGDTTLPQLIGVGGPGGTTPPVGTIDDLTGTVYMDGGVTVADGVTLDFLFDGTLLGTAVTGQDGAYSFNVSSTDLTGGLLITDAVDHGNTYFQSNGPQMTITGVDLYGSTLRVLSDTASNAGLATAAGSLTGAGVNYSVSGSHLTTNSGIAMSMLGTYTLDGNITSAGEFSTAEGSKLIGSANVTVTGSSVALAGTFNRTGATTFTSTTGGIDLEGVGNVDTAAVSQGLTLTSAQNLTINNSYIDLNGGNLSASGTGYTSLTDGNGDANGVSITDSVIHGQGGNLVVTGSGGYDTFQEVGTQPGDAIYMDDSTLDTTGSGNLTLTATFNHNIDVVSGIAACEIYGSTLSVGSGALSINGTVQQASAVGTGADGADVYGLIIGQTSTIEATGTGGSVSLTGNTAGSTTVVSDDNSDENLGLFLGSVAVSVASGNLTVTGTSGTINANNSSATDENAPYTLGLEMNPNTSLTGGAGSTVTLAGTGGAVQSSGAYTGDSYGLLAQSSTVTVGEGGTLTVTGHAGAVNAGEGDNAADATSVGVQLDGVDFSVTDGSIAMTGTGGTLNASQAGTLEGNVGAVSRGILIFDGALVQGLGTTTIALTGTGGNVTSGETLTGGSVGIDLGGNGEEVLTQVTTDSGNITIIGTGGTAPALGDGVLFSAFNGGATQVTSNSGNISVTGTGGAGYQGDGTIEGNVVPNYGVVVLDNVQVNTSGAVSFTGTAGGSDSKAVEVEELTDDPTFDESPTTPVINAAGGLSVTSTSGGVDLAGTATSNYYTTITTPGSSNSTIENSGGPYTLNGGNYALTGSTADVAAGNMGNLTIDVSGNITLGTLTEGALTAGTITLDAGSAVTQNGAVHASELVVTSAGDVTLTNTGNNISTLGDISSGSNIEIYTDPGLTIAGTVSGDGDITIQEMGGNLTLGANGQVLDVGEGNNITLVTNKNFINNSSSGSGAVSSESGNYYVYANSPTGSSLGGLPVDFTLYNTTYPASGLPEGNGVIYASSPGGTTPPKGPGTLPDGGTPVPPAIIPQNDQIAPQDPGTGILAQTTPQTAPFSTSGNGVFTQTTADSGDLADFYGNSGQIGANDAAQLNNGEMNNVSDPAAAGALDQALSTAVHNTLLSALSDVNVVVDADATGAQKAETTSNGKLLGDGDVVEIGGGNVKQIPLNKAPKPLQNALGNGVRNGLQPGAGH